jgi:hypothetical protein
MNKNTPAPQEEPITYGVDMGAPNGDMTALSIKRGKTLYNFVGDEAVTILALIASEKAASLEKLIAEHDATCGATFPEHERDNCNFRSVAIAALAAVSPTKGDTE